MEDLQWKNAKSPNYDLNDDLKYPYTEAPFQYNDIIKIPASFNLVEHIDYFGEGLIVNTERIRGFPHCYNVNYEYKLISTGGDAGRKIPNRIPIMEDCDTCNYIKDNSVKLVTITEAIIQEECALDIARIVNMDIGKVITFGYTDDCESIRNLEKELSVKNLFHYPSYDLCGSLNKSNFSYRVYLNLNQLKDILYSYVAKNNYNKAIDCTKFLLKHNKECYVKDTVNKLLKVGNKYVMSYAYKLWNEGEKKIVTSCFPNELVLILNEDPVRMVSENNFTRLIDAKDISVLKNIPWFHIYGYSKKIVNWKLKPFWKEEEIAFKFKYTTWSSDLKFDIKVLNQNEIQNEKYIESEEISLLQPVIIDKILLFNILNYEHEKDNLFNAKLYDVKQNRTINRYLPVNMQRILDVPDTFENFNINVLEDENDACMKRRLDIFNNMISHLPQEYKELFY